MFKLLQSERKIYDFLSPTRIFETIFDGKIINYNHADYGFMHDGRLGSEGELLPTMIPFVVSGIPARYEWVKNRDNKGFDGYLNYGPYKEKASCKNVTKAMMKAPNLKLHKSIGNGGGREDYSYADKIKDIENVKWHLLCDIRDSTCWRISLLESEAILEYGYTGAWKAQDLDGFHRKYGYTLYAARLKAV